MKNASTLLGLAAFVAAVLAVPAYGQAQQATPRVQGEPHQHQGEADGLDAGASEPRLRMNEMMGEMHAADAKLDALVLAMDAAKGPEKVDAVAAVVSALVEQHRAMRGSMTMMMGRMSAMDKSSATAAMPAGKPKP